MRSQNHGSQGVGVFGGSRFWGYFGVGGFRKLSEAFRWIPFRTPQEAVREGQNPSPNPKSKTQLVTPGKPLFIAPKSRNWGDFDRETRGGFFDVLLRATSFPRFCGVSLVLCCLFQFRFGIPDSGFLPAGMITLVAVVTKQRQLFVLSRLLAW